MWALLAFSGSLLIYLAVAFPRLGETQFYGLGIDASVPHLIATLGGSDAGSYTTIAYDFLDGRIEDQNRWILNLWPPGVPFLLWFIMLVNDGTLPIVPFVVITGVVWSAALALLAWLLIHRRAFMVLGLFSLAWLLTPLLTGWIVQGGAISSDGISAALTAVLALGLLLIGEPEFDSVRGLRRHLYFGALGLLLGVLCLFRVTWLFAILASAGALVLYLSIRAIVRVVRRHRHTDSAPKPLARTLPWIAAAVGFAIVVVPWTGVVGRVVHPGNYSWSQGDYQLAQAWMTDERLAELNADFLIDGEVNYACKLDPVQCAEIEATESAMEVPYGGLGANSFADFGKRAVLTALANPIPFVGARSATTFVTWMSTPGERVGAWSNVPFGIVSLIAFLSSLVLLVWQSARGRSAAFFLLMLTGANLGLIWLSHFETRYLLPLQVIGLVVVAVYASRRESSAWRRLLHRQETAR
ncbi:MAG TPA: hypothetical protein VNQ52_00775 [Microbacteriaceae bacterium]|nr:hypothetical protein [Microbacteriaceae bacterium]